MVVSGRVVFSGRKNKKNEFLSYLYTTVFKDFMRCRRFQYIHAEEASRALHEDGFGALASLRSQ